MGGGGGGGGGGGDGSRGINGYGMIRGLLEERACNSPYACREMLVVTKNRIKCMGGWQRQLCGLR